MKPQWGASGTINHALELIGVPRPQVGDRFSAIGLEVIRSNDDLLSGSARNPRLTMHPSRRLGRFDYG
jgi:hypothetical protein